MRSAAFYGVLSRGLVCTRRSGHSRGVHRFNCERERWVMAPGGETTFRCGAPSMRAVAGAKRGRRCDVGQPCVDGQPRVDGQPEDPGIGLE